MRPLMMTLETYPNSHLEGLDFDSTLESFLSAFVTYSTRPLIDDLPLLSGGRRVYNAQDSKTI